MGHPFKKSLFDNDDSAFQTPFLRTDVLSSQHTHANVDVGYGFHECTVPKTLMITKEYPSVFFASR